MTMAQALTPEQLENAQLREKIAQLERQVVSQALYIKVLQQRILDNNRRED
jgi:cell division protein FtsL